MADFKFYLSRQGPKGEPGAKGEKGDNGNTPTFSDGINTPTVYTMQIDMGDGNVFETQNLKYPMRDDGGNYLRYDRTDSTVTLSAPNIADLQRTSGEVTLASVSDVENEDAQDTDAVSMELRNADQLALSNEINRIDGDIDAVDDKIDREIQDRQDADTQLTNKINTDVGNEATTRGNADTALSGRIDGLDSSKANKSDVYTKTQTDTLLNGKANTVHTHTLSQITNAGSLAGKNTVDYSTEVTNKPTIGNGIITITQGGVTKGTFTTNQSGDSTIALDAGGGGVNFTTGTGLELTQQNVLNVKIDGTTITTNASGELVANSGGGTTYIAGDGIDLTNDEITVKYDNNTLKLNSSGQLYADIPAPETVDQTYDATSTNAQSGVAIAGAGFLTSVPTATTSNLGLVQPDGTTITINNGVISAASSTPSNMVTTDTSQDISGTKTFRVTTSNYTPTLRIAGNSSTGNNDFIVLDSNDYTNPAGVSIGYSFNLPIVKVFGGTSGAYSTFYTYNGLYRNGSDTFTFWKDYSKNSKMILKNYQDTILDSSMVDGTTITYDSSTGKISATANPPVATSSSTGVVQPDNSTITVDGSGVISAVNNSIAKTAPVIPLEYVETEDGVSTGIGGTLNHTVYTDYADKVYVADASTTGIYNMSGDGYIYQSASNMMSKIFYRGYKIRLDNGLNIAWNIAEGSGFFMNVAVGHYDNGTFVPVLYALNTNSYGGSMFARPALEIASDVYDMGRLNTQFEGCVGVSLLGSTLSAFSPTNGRHTYTISGTLLTELQKCTHAICTVINESSTGTTFNYSTGKFVNPAATLSDDLEVRNTVFSAAENLILNDDVTVIPELKLNYDSTYFKVVNNQLTLDIQAIKDAIDALSSSSGTASQGNDLGTGGWD